MEHTYSAARASLGSVLVVDDNDANRLLVQDTLVDEDYEVRLAANGAEAIASFQTNGADCVVLDVRMPGQDGFDVCRAIRALPGGAEVPVIFLTALRDVDTFDQAALAGGNDFLTKPVRPVELTARVRTALELRRTNAELRGAAAELKEQRDALQRAQLANERLTAYIVHDLKSPVNVIDLYAQLLANEPELPVSAGGSVTAIREAVRRLVRMISNLLDVSKGNEGRLVPKLARVQADTMLAAVVNELSVTAAARAVQLRALGGPVEVRADKDLLHRALVNLAENAVRHAPDGSTVTLSAEHFAGQVVLAVADQGPGVPADRREAVFAPFVQLAGTANAGGRGLGLAFCKLVATAHGGTILVRDGAPGAVFEMTLPDGQ